MNKDKSCGPCIVFSKLSGKVQGNENHSKV